MTWGLPSCGPRSARFLSRYPRPIPAFPSLHRLTTAFNDAVNSPAMLRLVIGWLLKNEMQEEAVESNLRQAACSPGLNSGPWVGLPIRSGAEAQDREVQCCHTNSKRRESVTVGAWYVFSMLLYQIHAIHQGGRVLVQCFVWIWEQTAIISLYSINWLVCITETECVYCAARTGSSDYVFCVDLRTNSDYFPIQH
jgi:hypothetical protein